MEVNTIVSKFLLVLIIAYRRYLSPLKPSSCRFYPSCSEYAELAIKKYGIKGILFALKRLLKCHPFSQGGYDPLR